jgi:hypothetical protein
MLAAILGAFLSMSRLAVALGIYRTEPRADDDLPGTAVYGILFSRKEAKVQKELDA